MRVVVAIFLMAAIMSAAQVAVAAGFDPSRAQVIGDSAAASQLRYEALSQPGETDLYAVTPSRNVTLPIEVVVPARYSNRQFRPEVAVLDATGQLVRILPRPNQQPRDTLTEPLTDEKFYRGNRDLVSLPGGRTTYLAVSEPDRRTGDYVLGLGSVEHFAGTDKSDLIGQALALKFALSPGKDVPTADFIGLFIMLIGLIVGLGAITVIDVLGILGRKSAYWTELAVRVSVTRRLSWAGVALLILGMTILYRQTGSSGVATFQEFLLLIIIANALFLTFRINPRLNALLTTHGKTVVPAPLQRRIIGHFIISFLAWWSFVGLTAWYLIVAR